MNLSASRWRLVLWGLLDFIKIGFEVQEQVYYSLSSTKDYYYRNGDSNRSGAVRAEEVTRQFNG